MRHIATGRKARSSHVVRAAAIEVGASSEPPAPLALETPEPRESEDGKALHDLMLAMDRQIAELHGRRRHTIGEVADLCVELAVILAERLLCTEIAANRQRLDRIVKLALNRLPVAPSVTVRGHRDDISLLEKQLADQNDLHEMPTLQVDPGLARGELRLEAGAPFVAWNTASGLAEIRAELLAANLTDE